jgi:hypothetical protein
MQRCSLLARLAPDPAEQTAERRIPGNPHLAQTPAWEDAASKGGMTEPRMPYSLEESDGVARLEECCRQAASRA